MSIKVYNKIVRDQIPEIIKSHGGIPTTKILNSEETVKYLKEKLMEEVQEYLLDDDVEELADICEVLYAILDEQNISLEDFERIRQHKSHKNGKFEKKIFLISVSE